MGPSFCLRSRSAVTEEKAGAKAAVREKGKVKLSYKETRKLESLPEKAEAQEAEQQALAAKMSALE